MVKAENINNISHHGLLNYTKYKTSTKNLTFGIHKYWNGDIDRGSLSLTLSKNRK